MKVLVAGGKGFIGSHLVNYLKAKGHWVRSVDVERSSYLKTKEDEFLPLDLRRYEKVEKAVDGVDWIFNLAANMGGIGFISAYGADIMHDNALINIYMAEAAVKNNVERMFFSSSACIYPAYKQQTPEGLPLKEEFAVPAEPDQFYGWEKLFSEKLYEAYQRDYGLKTRMARFHNIYGPYGTYKGGREKAPAALCRKVALAKDEGYIRVWGDGKQTRSFLYIDDCLRGLWTLMNADYDQPLNIGSDRLVTIDELANIIIGISRKKLRIRHDSDKPQGVRGRNADLTLVRRVIGWEPKVSLEEGLGITYDWINKMVKK